MKILLIDVDSKIPNIALMKISGYYKSKGNEVTLLKLDYNGYPSGNKKPTVINIEKYDRVFISIIFTVNKNVVQLANVNNQEILWGGTGYDLTIKLPQEIDDFPEDYSIYPENNISYGFITRGCIRNCYFCFVPKKEGLLHKYRELDQIIKHNKVMFLDNNFLAYNKSEEIMEELIKRKTRCQFNQGLDLRLMTERKAELLSKLNYIGEFIFAFDDIKSEQLIKQKLDLFKKYVPKDWKVKLFVYCNAETPLHDVIYRIEWCKQNKVLPYLMRDKNCWVSKNTIFYNNLSAYCNQPALFKKMSFNEFIEKRTKNISTQELCKKLYLEACEK